MFNGISCLAWLGLFWLIHGVVVIHAKTNNAAEEQKGFSGYSSPAKDKDSDMFTFVVIGDSCGNIEVFNENIKAINQLDPDLVIHVGDMIPNFYPNPEKHWDRFDEIIKRLEPTLYRIPGNHDISDVHSFEVYKSRYGKTYYSFDHKNVHFVCLYSETLGSNLEPIDRIDSEQLRWLKDDLGTNKNALATFVFIHKPLWESVLVPHGFAVPGTGDNWAVDWYKNILPVLADYNVSAVFAGHTHRFLRMPPVKGVTHIITGGGGQALHVSEPEGGYYHFSLVTVEKSKWKLDVIRTDGIEAETLITPPFNMLINTKIKPIEVPIKVTSVSSVDMEFHNLCDRELKLTIEPLTKINPHYKMDPKDMHITLAPEQIDEISFNLSLDDIKHAYPVPQLKFRLESFDGEPIEEIMRMGLKPYRTALCQRALKPIKIDGKINEIDYLEKSSIRDFWVPTAEQPARFPTKGYLAYDSENLYVTVWCYEHKLSGLVTKSRNGTMNWGDDLIEIFIDTNLDRRTYYHFAFNADGVGYAGIGRGKNNGAKFFAKVGRESDAWTLEVKIPWETLEMTVPKPGTNFGLGLVRLRAQNPVEFTHWSPTFGENHVPEQFGTIVFE